MLGCRQARTLFFGDPDTIPVKPTEHQVHNARGLGPSLSEPPDAVKTAPPMRLPGGGLASREYAEATSLQSTGQLWRARLILSPKAMSKEGTREELTLIAEICKAQGDIECIDQAHEKLGLPPVTTELEHLRRLAKKDPKAVRATLLPKLDGEARVGPEELFLLRGACDKLKDKTCIEKLRARSDKLGDNRLRSMLRDDPSGVRLTLEPKVKAGKATKQELALLCSACVLMADEACQKQHCP
jgi:hypothetical protein